MKLSNINKLVYVSCLCHFVIGCVITTRGIFIHSISLAYQMTPDKLGIVYTAFNVGILAAIACSGWFIQKLGLKTLFTAACQIALALILLFNFFHDIYAYTSMMFALGFICGILLPSSSYLLVSTIANTDRNSSKIILTDFFFSLAGIMFPVVFSYLLLHHVPWYALYNVLIVPCIAMLILIRHTQFPFTPHDNAKAPMEKPAMVVYISACGSFFYILFEMILSLWLASYIELHLNVTLLTASMFVTAYWLAKAAGLWTNHLLIPSIGTERFLRVSSSIGLLCLLFILAGAPALLVILLIIVSGFVCSGTLGALVGYGCSALSRPCAKTVSFIYLIGTIGTVISSWSSGLLVNYFNIDAAILFALASYAAYFCCLFLQPSSLIKR